MIGLPSDVKSNGEFIRPSLPFSSVAGAAFKQGFHDTFFNVIQENVEESIYNEGLMLTPEEANNRYSLPGLEFNEPIREGLAALKFRRKQSEIARQTVMQHGTNGLLSLRGVGSMATSIIANNLSPIDFAFNFAPIAGATRYGRASSLMSKAASRGVKKLGGLGKPVSKVSMPAFHRMVSAGIDASVGNLVLEVPLYFQNEKDQTRHTLGDVALNVGLGGMFGMGLSGLGTMMRGAARKWAAASSSTKAKAIQAHFNEAKADEAARIADEVLESDPNVIRQRVISAKEAAAVEVDARMPEIERQVRARLKVQGKLGDAPQEAIEEIAERALPILERKADGRAKIVKRLLERSKNGEVDATENLAEMFHLEHNPKSKGAPEPFITGKVSGRASAQQMVNLEDVIDALPKRAKKDLGMANVDRFDVEAEIKREVESARIRLVQRSYREALEKMKANDTKAQRVAQELDANAEPSKPLRPQDDVRGQAADEATLTEDISVLTEAMGDAAKSVKKNFNQGPDEKGLQAGLDCLIKNA
jgi:hypothetical protein